MLPTSSHTFFHVHVRVPQEPRIGRRGNAVVPGGRCGRPTSPIAWSYRPCEAITRRRVARCTWCTTFTERAISFSVRITPQKLGSFLNDMTTQTRLEKFYSGNPTHDALGEPLHSHRSTYSLRPEAHTARTAAVIEGAIRNRDGQYSNILLQRRSHLWHLSAT